MLGAFFSNAATALKPSSHAPAHSSAKQNVPLESVQEEMHTRGLLFPDASQLHQSPNHIYPLSDESPPSTVGSATGFDGQGEVDLQNPRDVRIIVAQDATGSLPKAVLFDSKAPTAAQKSRRPSEDATSPLRPSQSTGAAEGPLQGKNRGRRPQKQAQAPPAPRHTILPPSQISNMTAGGSFDRSQRRGVYLPAHNDPGQRAPPIESPGDTRLLLDCMFGTAPLSYKGDSTKLHVFPDQEKPEMRSSNPSSYTSEGQGSFGRAEGRRRSQLAQSHTPGDLSSWPAAGMPNLGTEQKDDGRKMVVITRTFSINAPGSTDSVAEQDDRTSATQSGLMGISSSFPFPRFEDGAVRKRPKQCRIPMYAIALVLQIPSTTNPGARHALGFPSGSGQASSFDSDYQSGWTFLDSNQGLSSSPSSPTYASDIDDRLDVVTQHWDIITRTLSSVQRTVRASLSMSLQVALVDITQAVSRVSPHPQARSPAQAPRSLISSECDLKEAKHTLSLLPAALANDRSVQIAVACEGARLVEGLRTPRVVTGQDRWAVWREEARWVGQWGAGKEQKFLFFNLLTAFLGNHTGWLRALGPKWHRKRHYQQQKANSGDDYAITNRTVIVANDKMAARRLIFLLSAFLPAVSDSFDGLKSSSTRRFSRSKSTTAFSFGPPSNQTSRRNSLRRSINRKPGVGAKGPNRKEHQRAVSFSKEQPSDEARASLVADQRSHISRCSSDVRSIQAASLPIPHSEGGTRKSSAATTATITPATTVPHFSSISQGQPSDKVRADSNESLASMNLMQTLKRNDSTDQSIQNSDSQPPSRWGSLVSGFWSNRGDSSTDNSVTTAPPDDVSDFIDGRGSQRSKGYQTVGKLTQMVQEAKSSQTYESALQHSGAELSPVSSSLKHLEPPIKIPEYDQGLSGQDIPRRPRTNQAQFKLSVDENDGVIDVEVPLPTFLSSSIGSPGGSASVAGFKSTESFDSLTSNDSLTSGFNFPPSESDVPINVAGWLKTYHPDFVLQAVRPYSQLEEDIKDSMRAEPTPSVTAATPSLDGEASEKWVDVCTTLIADTQTFSVKRLRLRRRVDNNRVIRQPQSADATAARPATSKDHERFIEEPIFDMDDTLIDAVERVIAQSGPSSKAQSTASSRSSSRVRGRDNSNNMGLTAGPMLEVPRAECQKMVLGALEQVVKSVTVERRSNTNPHTNEVMDDVADDGKSSATTSTAAAATAAGPGGSHASESTLREGVRKWLNHVEDSR
ncbi:MAG: hypothetical protein M1837_001192 [Sclerophora amabilis]|nr:MAG: hypothetical protein M1837_001192 [Sclerophora amabilis]